MIRFISVIVKNLFTPEKQEEIRKVREQLDAEHAAGGLKFNGPSMSPEEYFKASDEKRLKYHEYYPIIDTPVYEDDALRILRSGAYKAYQVVYNLAAMYALQRNSYDGDQLVVEKEDVEQALVLYNKRGSLKVPFKKEVRDIKQVIVIRKKYIKDDKSFGLRRGKEIAQACHASMVFLVNKVKFGLPVSDVESEWLNGLFTKTVVTVDTEEELQEIYDNARAKELVVHMITDAGKTEFDGIPTKTALAIGPDLVGKIDEVTGHLKLY